MSANKSQCAAIAEHLRSGLTLTALEALRLFGCARAAARVEQLRKQGMNIITRMVEVTGPNGKARVAEYSIAKEVA